MTYNFCLPPLSKDNILKISTEIDDYLLIKNSLQKAISIYNNSNNEGIQISEDTSLYKVRLAKKNGMPNFDFPG